MASPICEPTIPDHLRNYHLKVRAPALPAHRFGKRVGEWTGVIMNSAYGAQGLYQQRPLDVKDVERVEDGTLPAVYIKFELSRYVKDGRTKLVDVIRDLCKAITDSRQKNHVWTLSHRGLFGITPIHPSARKPFRDSIARRTYQEGLGYLQEIDETSQDYLPSWNIAMNFAIVAGINIFPLYFARAYSNKLSKKKGLSWEARMLQLYGPAAVETAGAFLTRLFVENENIGDPGVTQQNEEVYGRHLQTLEGRIQGIIEKIRTMHGNSDIVHHNSEILDLCYEALDCFAECMKSQQNLLMAYVSGRKDATSKMSKEAGYSAAMILNTLIMAKTTIVVPLAKRNFLQVCQGVLSWTGLVAAPTAAAFAPVTIGVSLAAAGVGIYNLYRTAEEKKRLEAEIAQLGEAAKLVSSAWTITDETGFFLKWTHCTKEKYRQDAEFLKEANAESVVTRWETLVEKTEPSQKRNNSSGPIRWFNNGGQLQANTREKRSGKKREESMMARCIQVFVGQQADELERILNKLRSVGAHD